MDMRKRATALCDREANRIAGQSLELSDTQSAYQDACYELEHAIAQLPARERDGL